jgi:hypothetical protein
VSSSRLGIPAQWLAPSCRLAFPNLSVKRLFESRIDGVFVGFRTQAERNVS